MQKKFYRYLVDRLNFIHKTLSIYSSAYDIAATFRAGIKREKQSNNKMTHNTGILAETRQEALNMMGNLDCKPVWIWHNLDILSDRSVKMYVGRVNFGKGEVFGTFWWWRRCKEVQGRSCRFSACLCPYLLLQLWLWGLSFSGLGPGAHSSPESFRSSAPDGHCWGS